MAAFNEYPLSLPEPSAADVQQRLDTAAVALGHVSGKLLNAVDTRLQNQTSQLTSVISKITKGINKSLTTQAKMLVPVQATLASEVNQRIASNGVNLSLAAPPGALTPTAPPPPPLITPSTQFTAPCIPTNLRGNVQGLMQWANTIYAPNVAVNATEQPQNTVVFVFASGGSTVATYCPDASPTPPIPPAGCVPGGVTPSATGNGQWYCVVVAGGVVDVIQVEDADVASIPNAWQGPYPTSSAAQAACGCGAVSPPPPPPPPPTNGTPPSCPPPPPPPPPIVIPACPTPPATGAGTFQNTQPIPYTLSDLSGCAANYPAYGSPEFCAQWDGIQTTVTAIGQQIVNWVDANFASSVFPGPVPPQDTISVFSTPAGSIIATIQNFLNWCKQGVATFVDNLRSAYNWIKSAVCHLPVCNPAGLISIWVFKAAVRLLENVNFGTDALAWLTATFKMEMASVNQFLAAIEATICPMEIPSINQAIDAYLMGAIDRPLYLCWLALNGGNHLVWDLVVQARRSRLQADELIDWGRRNGFPDNIVSTALQSLGYINADEAQSKLVLYDSVPGLTEITSWISHGSTNDAIAAAYGLDTGFYDALWPTFGNSLRANGITQDRAALNWRSHWVYPDASTAAEMLYRLRPGKPGVTQTFTSDDYFNMVAARNIAPYFRPLLAQIAYKLPALRQYRIAYQNGIVSDASFQSYFQDTGYSNDDANTLVQSEAIIKARTRANSGHGWTPSALAKAYASQQITGDTVTQQMGLLGYSADESSYLMKRADSDLQYAIYVRARAKAISGAVSQVTSAINVGIMDVRTATDALQRLGYPANFAAGIAQSEWTTGNIKLIQQSVARIKHAYLSGEIDATYVGNSLAVLGIVPDKQTSYLASWQVQNTPNRKRRTAAQIVADLAAGNMEQPDAYVRLTNLGYNDADTRLYFADAQARAIKLLGAEQAAQDRVGKARIKAQEQIVKQAAQVAKEQLDSLKRAEPISKLQKWVKLGLTSHQYFMRRMEMYGLTESEAQTYYDEACSSKNAQCEAGTTTQNGTTGSEPAG